MAAVSFSTDIQVAVHELTPSEYGCDGEEHTEKIDQDACASAPSDPSAPSITRSIGAAAAPVDDFVSQLSDAGLKEKVRAGWTQHGETAKLYLHKNKIGDAGTTALARALEKNTVLTYLSLNSNNIGDAGATALAGALEKNTMLTELFLGTNKIGDVGATALAGAQEKNTMLTELFLGDNKIGDARAAPKVEAVEVLEAVDASQVFCCEWGCGFKGSYDTVEGHEDGCNRRPAALAGALEKNALAKNNNDAAARPASEKKALGGVAAFAVCCCWCGDVGEEKVTKQLYCKDTYYIAHTRPPPSTSALNPSDICGVHSLLHDEQIRASSLPQSVA
jgi:hypothetical protein